MKYDLHVISSELLNDQFGGVAAAVGPPGYRKRIVACVAWVHSVRTVCRLSGY